MKVPTNKHEALILLKCLQEDFDAAMYGEWVPDEDSCLASRDIVLALMVYVQQIKEKEDDAQHS
jgi:hypothetical protein